MFPQRVQSGVHLGVNGLLHLSKVVFVNYKLIRVTPIIRDSVTLD